MKELTQQQKELAASSVKYAKSVADYYAKTRPSMSEDIESAAMFGLVSAASNFKPQGKGCWEAWAKMYINSRIGDVIGQKYATEEHNTKSIEEDIYPDEKAKDPTELIELRDEFERLVVVAATLTPSEREMCLLIYKEGLEPHEAAKRLGFTRNHGCKLHRNAVRKLREAASA